MKLESTQELANANKLPKVEELRNTMRSQRLSTTLKFVVQREFARKVESAVRSVDHSKLDWDSETDKFRIQLDLNLSSGLLKYFTSQFSEMMEEANNLLKKELLSWLRDQASAIEDVNEDYDIAVCEPVSWKDGFAKVLVFIFF